ncbi:MAG: macro domain-containing protein [Myxococcota bacterium]
MTRIVLIEGDLTEQDVDAIVNAANSDLVLGSGVAGAIAQRGGAAIAEACAAHGPIEVGEVALTGAGELPARAVIHAAGMAPGGSVSEESLRSVLQATFALAEKEGFRSVACPAIGTGVGGLGMQVCAEISLEEARRYAEAAAGREGAAAGAEALDEIRFVLFGEPSFRLFEMVNDAAKVEAQMRKLRGR